MTQTTQDIKPGMNKLIIIGFMGDYIAYMNVPLDEAKKRYAAAVGYTDDLKDLNYRELEFKDEFCVYDAWASD